MCMAMASMSFSLPEHLVAGLDALARAQNRTRSAQARRIFEAALTSPDTAVPPAAGAAGIGVVTGAGPPAHF
jgi:metal-responsive CopG/Arc/MetJ family transcriptional regulator